MRLGQEMEPRPLPDILGGSEVVELLEAYMRDRELAVEMERMCRLAPDVWMEGAVGEPVSSEPLLTAAREALEGLAE